MWRNLVTWADERKRKYRWTNIMSMTKMMRNIHNYKHDKPGHVMTDETTSKSVDHQFPLDKCFRSAMAQRQKRLYFTQMKFCVYMKVFLLSISAFNLRISSFRHCYYFLINMLTCATWVGLLRYKNTNILTPTVRKS